MTSKHGFHDLSFRFVLKSDHDEANCQAAIDAHDVPQLLTTQWWQIEQLETLRNRLNLCKSQVGRYPLNEWQRHTDFTDLASDIKVEITRRLTNTPPILTRAWIKFYDILCNFPLVDPNSDPIRMLFLCEAPGGFVNATNHYIKSRPGHQGKFDWVANALNPHYENISGSSVLDDRFIKDINCHGNWFFGQSNTGDILEPSFCEDLQKHTCARYETDGAEIFDCVTGDGAFDCLDCPERQEEMVFELIFTEIVTGTKMLKPNGSMVIKFFTLFNCTTLSLLYLVCHWFGTVISYKPTASKHGNSEMYLVCLNFNRDRYQRLSPYLEGVKAEQFVLNLHLIPPEFISKVCQLAHLLSARQRESIDLNVKRFGTIPPAEEKEIRKMKRQVAGWFLTRYNLYSIAPNEQLLFQTSENLVYSRRLFKLFNHSDPKTLVPDKLWKVIESIRVSCLPTLATSETWFQTEDTPTYVYGRPYPELNNSKFCCTYVMKAFNTLKSSLPRRQSANCRHHDTSSDDDNLSKLFDFYVPQSGEQTVCFYGRTPFTELIERKAEFLRLKEVKYCMDSEPNSNDSTIHLIDLYDMAEGAYSNHHDQFEVCVRFRHHITTLLRGIQAGNTLMVRTKTWLSRLGVGLLYTLTRTFRQFGTHICYTELDHSYPSLFCVFSQYAPRPARTQLIDSTFGQQSNQCWSPNLLEVMPIPIMIADSDFYRAIFNANSACLLLFLKQHRQVETTTPVNAIDVGR